MVRAHGLGCAVRKVRHQIVPADGQALDAFPRPGLLLPADCKPGQVNLAILYGRRGEKPRVEVTARKDLRVQVERLSENHALLLGLRGCKPRAADDFTLTGGHEFPQALRLRRTEIRRQLFGFVGIYLRQRFNGKVIIIGLGLGLGKLAYGFRVAERGLVRAVAVPREADKERLGVIPALSVHRLAGAEIDLLPAVLLPLLRREARHCHGIGICARVIARGINGLRFAVMRLA